MAVHFKIEEAAEIFNNNNNNNKNDNDDNDDDGQEEENNNLLLLRNPLTIISNAKGRCITQCGVTHKLKDNC